MRNGTTLFFPQMHSFIRPSNRLSESEVDNNMCCAYFLTFYIIVLCYILDALASLKPKAENPGHKARHKAESLTGQVRSELRMSG